MELPKIVSVDDHVVEPPHLWLNWLPAKFRSSAPRVERRGVAKVRVVGPGPRYAHDFDPSGTPSDCWVRRNADRGVHAVAFSEIPAFLGLPSIHSGYWEPFFAACADTLTTLCMHIGSSSKMPATSEDAPYGVQATVAFNNAMASLADFLWSGLLVRHPTLRLAYSESQIGWIPFLLERIDSKWRDARGWLRTADIPEPPSFYYYRQVFGCFFDDRHGMKSLDEVGVDNVTFETDYPHTDSTWPHTKALAEELTAGLPDDVAEKVMRGNARRMLSLDQA